jgi:hypothetical protein
VLTNAIFALTTSLTNTAELANPFQGNWYTTAGVIALEQSGEVVTASHGLANRFSIKGKATGNKLVFEYEEDQAKGNDQFLLHASANASTGTFQSRADYSSLWNGWKPETQALREKMGSISDVWLTDRGLMELVHASMTVQGHSAVRGNLIITGEVASRRISFHYQSCRSGHGWFDVANDSRFFAGAGNSDGYAARFSWNGRKVPEFRVRASRRSWQ